MAAVSGCGTASAYVPAASVRVESIARPPPLRDTSCSTTHAPGRGRPAGPYSTRPVTASRWAARPAGAPAAPAARPRSATSLRRELAEVFRIEVLEVRLQRVRVEGPGPGLAGLDRGEGQQVLAREDRRLEAQRHGDRVRRPGVDLDHGVAAIDMQLRVVGVVLHLRDDHLAQIGAQPHDDLFQEIVGERAGELDASELHGDRARLRGADPDGEHALPLLLLEDHDRRVGRAIEPQVGDADRDDVRAQVPSSQDARYARCSAVRVSIVTPIAASLSRAISASSSRGMRCTARASAAPCFATYSAARAWLANDMSMTLAGCPSAAARLISRPSASTNSRFPSNRHSSTNSRTRTGPWPARRSPSRSISTLKWPELARTAPSFISRMCSTRITFTFPVSVTKMSPTGAASAIGTTR